MRNRIHPLKKNLSVFMFLYNPKVKNRKCFFERVNFCCAHLNTSLVYAFWGTVEKIIILFCLGNIVKFITITTP